MPCSKPLLPCPIDIIYSTLFTSFIDPNLNTLQFDRSISSTKVQDKACSIMCSKSSSLLGVLVLASTTKNTFLCLEVEYKFHMWSLHIMLILGVMSVALRECQVVLRVQFESLSYLFVWENLLTYSCILWLEFWIPCFQVFDVCFLSLRGRSSIMVHLIDIGWFLNSLLWWINLFMCIVLQLLTLLPV